ncbi:hypothetical protein A9R05_21250 [Burkholderia sp. KK1]|nr:hypothetical protein A9R05_21250 [Burkholderia sp. KK1]
MNSSYRDRVFSSDDFVGPCGRQPLDFQDACDQLLAAEIPNDFEGLLALSDDDVALLKTAYVPDRKPVSSVLDDADEVECLNNEHWPKVYPKRRAEPKPNDSLDRIMWTSRTAIERNFRAGTPCRVPEARPEFAWLYRRAANETRAPR